MPPNQTAGPVTATTSTGCCGPSCGCGPQAPLDAEPGASPREITIDFLYLDLNTCERCVATGDTLDEALTVLAPVLSRIGVSLAVNKVNIKETHHRRRARLRRGRRTCWPAPSRPSAGPGGRSSTVGRSARRRRTER